MKRCKRGGIPLWLRCAALCQAGEVVHGSRRCRLWGNKQLHEAGVLRPRQGDRHLVQGGRGLRLGDCLPRKETETASSLPQPAPWTLQVGEHLGGTTLRSSSRFSCSLPPVEARGGQGVVAPSLGQPQPAQSSRSAPVPFPLQADARKKEMYRMSPGDQRTVQVAGMDPWRPRCWLQLHLPDARLSPHTSKYFQVLPRALTAEPP